MTQTNEISKGSFVFCIMLSGPILSGESIGILGSPGRESIVGALLVEAKMKRGLQTSDQSRTAIPIRCNPYGSKALAPWHRRFGVKP